MGRLYGSLFVLLMVFSTGLAFISDGVYAGLWWVSVIGVGILVVFAGLGGALVPPARKALPADQSKTAMALLGAFGAVLGAEFFTMALFCWIIGNRTLAGNNAYQALGLLIFLGLLGVGIQGAIGAIGWFAYVYNRSRVEGGHAG